ncbi:MAG TPA: hypothetical protein PLR32_04935 [candidate division Zixibacteria bacterium]|nr:hypothetical protein [candidate division Zixibacteria bacterium]MDD4916874.1 hypothetical protein [candidate division Zixibacteria bacterium]MDM7971462.1 hypothetical protein [candidate division Zixibacteria bacterium]HOD67147.1 hypothetical protein [candidate division Zixibacteria bacterium]HOZ07268.1 hypothetical protein [candidate division Zixibacteria bacterium]
MALFRLLLAGLMLVLGGCASQMTAVPRVEELLPAGARVAVLPFENLSGTESAAEIVTSHFQTLLAGLGRIDLAEHGDVYAGLRQYRIRSATRITRAEIDSLCALLRLDYLLVGSVLEFDQRDDRFLGVVPTVSYNCRLLDGKTGETVWVAANNGRGDKGEIVFGIGAIRSADQLALAMVKKTVAEIGGLFHEP